MRGDDRDRTRRWAAKKRKAGLCPHCGKKPALGRKFCAGRLEYDRERKRKS